MAGQTEKISGIHEEIDMLKSTYPGQCKVIDDVGDFKHIVDVMLKELDMRVKFQITEDYPNSPANIFVKSKSLSADQKTDLLSMITTIQPVSLCQIMEAVQTWVVERGIDIYTNTSDEQKSPNRSPRHEKKKKTRKRSKIPEDETEEKASSMKTAENVIYRILWDETLQKEHFSIGYLDRFAGVVEKPFTVFSWEDLASVDYNVLAIPKHRIHYFKYKGHKFWDKKRRIDDMFGSTGSGKTIMDVIDEVEKLRLLEQTNNECHDANQSYLDSDSDDDIEIDTGCNLASLENDGLYPRERYWGPKSRPTHFVALRITNPDILAKVQEIQDMIVQMEPVYAQCIIPTERLHMTLCCIGLDTQEQVNQAVDVLERIEPDLDIANQPRITVKFKKIAQFFNNTLYACTEPNQQLLEYVDQLKRLSSEAGINIRDVFDFVPHMTIMKLSMQFGREMNTRYIDPRVFQIFGDTDFGSVTLNNIHLCAMSEDRQDDGFYECPTSLLFD